MLSTLKTVKKIGLRKRKFLTAIKKFQQVISTETYGCIVTAWGPTALYEVICGVAIFKELVMIKVKQIIRLQKKLCIRQ